MTKNMSPGASFLSPTFAGKATLYLCYGVFLLFIELHLLDKMVDGTVGGYFAFMRGL